MHPSGVVRSACLALLLLALAGCRRDEGPQQLARARAAYAALLDRGALPEDPGFDAVLAQLEAIPPTSEARPGAERLIAAIRSARQKHPGRPLAPAGPVGNAAPGSVEAQAAACARLAEQMGRAASPERERLAAALADCRQQLERLKAGTHAPGEAGHAD